VTIEVTRSEHGGVGLRLVPITRGLELTVEEAHKLAIVLLGGVSLPSLEASEGAAGPSAGGQDVRGNGPVRPMKQIR